LIELVAHGRQGSKRRTGGHDQKNFVVQYEPERGCWDNAAAEPLFLNLKMERVWQRQYDNYANATADIADYIVGFYNYKRINSALGNLPPAVY
jgi:putative transposase